MGSASKPKGFEGELEIFNGSPKATEGLLKMF